MQSKSQSDTVIKVCAGLTAAGLAAYVFYLMTQPTKEDIIEEKKDKNLMLALKKLDSFRDKRTSSLTH